MIAETKPRIYYLEQQAWEGPIPLVRYANSPQAVEFTIIGTYSADVVAWRGAITLDRKISTGHTLVRSESVTIAPSAGDTSGTSWAASILFDTRTDEFFAAVDGEKSGRTVIFVLRLAKANYCHYILMEG